MTQTGEKTRARFPSGGPAEWRSLPGAVIYLVAALQVLLFAGLLWRVHISSPFSDDLALIGEYINFTKTADLPAYLWLPHNEHRLVITRALVALDFRMAAGNGLLLIVVATGAAVAAAGALAWQITRDSGQAWLKPLACFGLILLLTTAQAAVCSIPVNSQHPVTVLLVVLSLILFNGPRGEGGGRREVIHRVLALLCAVLAGLASAVGLLIWPALAWSAWRTPRATRWLLAILALGLGYGLLYLQGVQSGDGAGGMAAPSLRSAAYFFAYLGLPFSRAPGLMLPAIGLGAVLFGVAVTALIHDTLKRADDSPQRRTALALIIFTLAAAAAAAFGRVDVEASLALPVRYTVLVQPLHAALVILALPYLVRWATDAGRRTRVLWAAAAAAAGLFGVQLAGAGPAVRSADAIEAAVESYRAGARDPAADHFIGDNRALADAVYSWLSKRDR